MTIQDLYTRIEKIDTLLIEEYKDGETCYAANLETEKEQLENVICSLEEQDINNIESVIISKIKWDTDGQKVPGLPRSVTIDIDITNAYLLEDFNGYADALSNYLSNKYGYCLESFHTDIIHNEIEHEIDR